MYKILKNGEIVESSISGEYAGWRPGKIFGSLDCKSGMRMNKENRVFFHTLADAVNEGYRPCKNCKPMGFDEWEQVKDLVPEESLEEFYNRK